MGSAIQTLSKHQIRTLSTENYNSGLLVTEVKSTSSTEYGRHNVHQRYNNYIA